LVVLLNADRTPHPSADCTDPIAFRSYWLGDRAIRCALAVFAFHALTDVQILLYKMRKEPIARLLPSLLLASFQLASVS